MSENARDSAAWAVPPDRYLAEHPPGFAPGCRRSSRYVTVRDGTRLAVDVHLPVGAEPMRFPTLAIFTPYYRRFALAPEAPPAVEASPNTGHYRDFFVPHGYAVVVTDTRGAGASFGSRDGLRSPVERTDTYDIADWIVRQPWSDGVIGATGISYVGAAADFLASTGHPAVRAVIPTFSVWDTYGDHQYPGGVLMTTLAPVYNELMLGLDQDRRDILARFPYFADPHYRGPAPVDEDPDGRLLREALAEHAANFDLTDFIHRLEFRDSGLSYDPDYTSSVISPYSYAERIGPGVAHYSISGWMDGGGFSNGAVTRFRSLDNAANRLLLGPWDHGARTNVSPFRQSAKPQFPLLAECLRFFDRHLKGLDAGLERERRVHYFTIGAETWRAADGWPPPEAEERILHLGADASLVPDPAAHEGVDEYRADYAGGSGLQTRYERLYAQAVDDYYGDWHGRDARMLTYTAAPFRADTELTGHPVAEIRLEADQRDCVLFAYVEDIDAEGHCRYVTEGLLRALHRRESEPPRFHRVVGPYHGCTRKDAALMTPGEPVLLRFALLPISWLFRAGHRLRLALAAADRDHFSRIPDGRPPRLRIFRGGAQGSRLRLPLIRRA